MDSTEETDENLTGATSSRLNTDEATTSGEECSFDLNRIKKILTTVYETKYYWELCKSTFVFLLALKIARECNKMVIPMREYKPFT